MRRVRQRLRRPRAPLQAHGEFPREPERGRRTVGEPRRTVDATRGQEVRMRRLRREFPSESRPRQASEGPHQAGAARMQRMWEKFQTFGRAQHTHEISRQVSAVSVHRVQKVLHYSQPPVPSHAGPLHQTHEQARCRGQRQGGRPGQQRLGDFARVNCVCSRSCSFRIKVGRKLVNF